MEKWCLFLILAILSNEALGFKLRNKRQSDGEDSGSTEDDVEDRYGWNRPNSQGRWPRPNQNSFPGQGQFPGQFPGQWQGQFPGQGQEQWPGWFPNPGQGQPGQGRPGQGRPGQGRPGQGQPGQWQPGQGQPGQGQPGQGQPGQGQPGQGQPGQGQPGQDQNTTLNPNANGSTTESSAVRACIIGCPVTAEYNPVCGSDNRTYDNPGRLTCAQACGVNVNLLRSSRCPGTVQSN